MIKAFKINLYRLKIIILMVLGSFLCSQKITAQVIQGYFQQDTIEVGKPVRFVLVCKYPSKLNVYFPNETFNFGDFIHSNIEPFDTYSSNGISTDSVIYHLKSFEIDSIQYLKLPIFVVKNNDSLVYFSKIDSVFFKSKTSKVVKPNFEKPAFLPTENNIDIFKFLLYLIVLLAAMAILYLFFGSTITRYLQLFQLRNNHIDFTRKFKRISEFELNENIISKALVLWKSHLQELSKSPYSSFTTKEISVRIKNEELTESLRNIDSAIYGGILSINIRNDLKVLSQIAEEFYEKRKLQLSEELKNKLKKK